MATGSGVNQHVGTWPLASSVNHNGGVWPLGSDSLSSTADQNLIPVSSDINAIRSHSNNLQTEDKRAMKWERKWSVCVVGNSVFKANKICKLILEKPHQMT